MGSCASSPDEPEPDILEFYQEAEQVGESQHIVKNSKVIVRRKRDRYLSINNYAVLRLLGEGRYGEVYLCRSALPGTRGFCVCTSTQDEDDESTTFAIKLVRRQLVTKEEFNILLKVQHPNIVALLEYIDDPTYPYVFLVFENCGGGPIAGCTNDGYLESEDGPWSEEKSSPLFLQLVSALAHLHSMGVFHRDIKPENVVFTSSRHTVKLIDFGESRMLRRKGLGDDSSRSTKGTPFFMASEMLSGLKFLNKEADVWALGVLLYLLTVGKVPFGCQTTNEIQLYYSIQHDELVFPPAMSLLLQDMLRGMLNRDLSKRSTLPFLMHHPWVRETPTASPTTRTLCTNPTLRSFDRESDGRKLDEGTVRADNPLAKPKRSPYFRALGASCLMSSGPMLDNEERSLSSTDPGICKTPVESSDRMMPDTPLGGILGISVRKKKMMIVDDQRKVIEHLRQLLAKAKQNEWKLDLSWAITAEGGLDEVLKESEQGRPYDVVIMDTYPYSRESKITGVDALRRLREIEEERDLEATLAVLSTTEEECPADLVDVAKELNVDVVHKPFTPVFVYELLRELGLRATSINYEDCLANIPEEDYAGRQYMVNATQRSEGRYTTRGNDTQSCPNTIDVPDDLFTTQCSCSTPSTPKSLSSLGGLELSSYTHYRQTLEWTTTKSETASHSLASSRHMISPI